jgi:hypothetical protein
MQGCGRSEAGVHRVVAQTNFLADNQELAKSQHCCSSKPIMLFQSIDTGVMLSPYLKLGIYFTCYF